LKYTVALSKDFILDLPTVAKIHEQIDGDKCKVYACVVCENGTQLKVPIRVRKDESDRLFITFDIEELNNSNES